MLVDGDDAKLRLCVERRESLWKQFRVLHRDDWQPHGEQFSMTYNKQKILIKKNDAQKTEKSSLAGAAASQTAVDRFCGSRKTLRQR